MPKLTREINFVLGGGAAINVDKSLEKSVEGQFLNKGFTELQKGALLLLMTFFLMCMLFSQKCKT